MSEDTCGISTRIIYEDLINRDFIRLDDDDEIHFNERGYQSFTLFKEFEFSKVEFSFDEIELKVNVVLLNSDQTVIKRKVITNLVQLDGWLNEVDSLEQVLKFTENKLSELFN